MNPALLSLEQAPKLSTALRFFTTAPLFLVLIGMILLFSGTDILQDRWNPLTLAITHSLTLGFISMCIIGALFQLLPVIVGKQILLTNLFSYLVHIFFTAGVCLLIAGFLSGAYILHRLSLYILVPTLLIFCLLLIINLINIKTVNATARGLKSTVIAFAIAISIGSALLTAYAWPTSPLLRELTNLHILWAVTGWILTTVIAVSFQTIPMFHITDEFPAIIKNNLIRLITLSLLTYSVFHIVNLQLAKLIILYAICTLIMIFSLGSLRLLYRRKKRMPDTSIWFIYFAFILLFLSCLSLIISMSSSIDLSMFTAILFFCGFAIPIILAMLSKIIPFLIWYHLHKIHNQLSAHTKIPLVTEIFSVKKAQWMFAVYFMSFSSLISALFYLNSTLIYISAVGWIVLGGMLFIFILQSLLLYQRFSSHNSTSSLPS